MTDADVEGHHFDMGLHRTNLSIFNRATTR